MILPRIHGATTGKPKNIRSIEWWLGVSLELILLRHSSHHGVLVKRHLLLISLKLSELLLLLKLRGLRELLLLISAELLSGRILLKVCLKLIWLLLLCLLLCFWIISCGACCHYLVQHCNRVVIRTEH